MLHMDFSEDIYVDIHILIWISTCRYLNVAYGYPWGYLQWKSIHGYPFWISIHGSISLYRYPKRNIDISRFRYLYKSMDIHTRVTLPDVPVYSTVQNGPIHFSSFPMDCVWIAPGLHELNRENTYFFKTSFYTYTIHKDTRRWVNAFACICMHCLRFNEVMLLLVSVCIIVYLCVLCMYNNASVLDCILLYSASNFHFLLISWPAYKLM